MLWNNIKIALRNLRKNKVFALVNILGNAVKYTPEQGKITFSLSEENNAAVFHISDTGYGISEEDLPHIFEKAVQIDRSRE